MGCSCTYRTVPSLLSPLAEPLNRIQGYKVTKSIPLTETQKYPKKNIENVKEGKLSPAMQDRFIRAEAANDNMFVGLPLFAAAIVCHLVPPHCSPHPPDTWDVQNMGCPEESIMAKYGFRSLETWPDSLPRL